MHAVISVAAVNGCDLYRGCAWCALNMLACLVVDVVLVLRLLARQLLEGCFLS